MATRNPSEKTESRSQPTISGKERDSLIAARIRGKLAILGTYIKLSGPGWLQSAITLGGGSLAGSLYLGVLGGYSLLWLQPLAIVLGVIMLSAISYVTLSTRQRPFDAINRHINPVLGWGWAIATVMANLVWSMPQFSLSTAAIRQNLFPRWFESNRFSDGAEKLMICISILILCTAVVWFYEAARKGIRLFEIFLKIVVGIIVISFIGVVIKMSLSPEGLDWQEIFAGFIPHISLVLEPVKTFDPYIQAVEPAFRSFWTQLILSQQRDVIISAAATAVGINMTFLMPYTLLKRGWDEHFRGLAIFDLATGLVIPFIITISCIIIASASQFHTRPTPGLLGETSPQGQMIPPKKSILAIAGQRIQFEIRAQGLAQGKDPQTIEQEIRSFMSWPEPEQMERILALPAADKKLAAMLDQRDAFDLAGSLEPLTGRKFSHYIFGIGVVGMAVSTIIMLMLINGFAVCEMLHRESGGWVYRLACLMPGIGILGPFLWKKAAFWLAVPTSVFGMTLLPVAYLTFFLMMNQRSLLGGNMPRGGKRVAWNLLMGMATGLAAFASIWCIWSKIRWYGLAVIGTFTALVIIFYLMRRNRIRDENI